MTGTLASHALRQYVDDELLRAPLLIDQLLEAVGEQIARSVKTLTPLQRANAHDLVEGLRARRAQVGDYFLRSLREQVQIELGRRQRGPDAAPAPPPPARRPGLLKPLKPLKPVTLALVDEDEVAVDVELAHCIEAIKNTAEYELRELQTFVGALVGDMELAADHNPFRPEAYARALWAAAQALPLSRGFQVELMRHAGIPLSQLLRQAYAASVSRLESMGIEPAAHRTLILPAGSRRSRMHDTTFSPDLRQLRETMPLPDRQAGMEIPLPSLAPVAPTAAPAWQAVAQGSFRAAARTAAAVPASPAPAFSRADRQGQELIERMFAAMADDDRVPADVGALLQRLRSPALRLALHDTRLLESEAHPLWDFINQVAYEAEMSPDMADPERRRLLHLVQATVQQVGGEPEQTTSLHGWAIERLQTYLRQRLQRRCAGAASQIGALQKLEDQLTVGHVVPSTLHGTLDVPQLDTVPSELMPESPPEGGSPGNAVGDGEAWLDTLRPGDWLRLFLQGQWVHVQLLWPGERREIWLFGDGASDHTWAVRRRALLTLKANKLMKRLTRRSLVGRAARSVHASALAEAA